MKVVWDAVAVNSSSTSVTETAATAQLAKPASSDVKTLPTAGAPPVIFNKTVSTVPLTVKFPKVPTEVKDDPTTVAFNAVPVNVSATCRYSYI